LALHDKHLKVSYLAEQWGLSDQFIRDLFKDEPGVIRVLRPEKSNGRTGGFKREYESMQIPESVLVPTVAILAVMPYEERSGPGGGVHEPSMRYRNH
jgi:hypothetical protein